MQAGNSGPGRPALREGTEMAVSEDSASKFIVTANHRALALSNNCAVECFPDMVLFNPPNGSTEQIL